MKRAVIVMTRQPLPGATKTRLIGKYTPRQAAGLHICFLADLAATLSFIDAQVIVAEEPHVDGGVIPALFGSDALYIAQSGDDLSARMRNAFSYAFSKGFESCILVGSDCPEISASDIMQAFDALQSCDCVLGPSEDGGYWLVGMNRLLEEPFDVPPQDEGQLTWRDAASAVEASGAICSTVRLLHDIDTPDAVRRLAWRIVRNPEWSRTWTARYVRALGVDPGEPALSIVVALYRESESLPGLFSDVGPLSEDAQIIMVCAEGDSGTIAKLESESRRGNAPWFDLVVAPQGRARQLNAGAAVAEGDAILFLHADSRLPAEPLKQMRTVLKDSRLGCFGVRFPRTNALMGINGKLSNLRASKRAIAFGDQGMFMDASLYRAMGGFPDLALMEDYQLSLDLRSAGFRPVLTADPILTSSRRYPRSIAGTLKLVWSMHKLRFLYRRGVDTARLAKAYRDIR